MIDDKDTQIIDLQRRISEKNAALDDDQQMRAKCVEDLHTATTQLAEATAKLVGIGKATTLVSKYVDCGDNSCLFKQSKGGMRTNGGCRCRDRPFVVTALSELYRLCVELIPKGVSNCSRK